MKNNKLLTLVLLFAMSFQVLHAYAIDVLDTHACEVSEYVHEFSHSSIGRDTQKHDICDIHFEFHTAFIVPQNITIKQIDSMQDKPYSPINEYKYDASRNFLKPPKFL